MCARVREDRKYGGIKLKRRFAFAVAIRKTEASVWQQDA